MGLLRVGGGISGIIEYLIYGRKQGQMMTRDELDERVVLHGDLELTGHIIDNMNIVGQKYLHLSFSVKERDLSVEKFREIEAFIREKITAAYGPDDLNVYSELQRPKVKNILNKTTGEWHERLDHIHFVIPEKNLITGKKENPVGFFDHNIAYFEAIQELANLMFGLASPKDNARINVSHADVVARIKEADAFQKGVFKDLKHRIINNIVVHEIKDYDLLQAHLRGIGTVKVVNAGKENEYLGVKEFGKSKFVNLREPEFRKAFFDLPETERAQTLGAGHTEKPSSRMRPKLTEAQYTAKVQDWVERRSKEVRYLNSGSKVYKKYFAASQEEKAEILAYYEQRVQNRRHTWEKEHDEHYRKHGRSTEHQRSAVADEWVFEKRAEQQAQTVGRDRQPGLVVSTLSGASNLRHRLHDLSEGNVASEQQRVELLVQAHAHDDVAIRRSEPARDELQRASGRHTGGINSATGRTSDTATAQLLRDEQEALRQDVGSTQATIKDIKLHLDANRLLADLAVSHLIIPQDYVISQGADGGARIRHIGGHDGSLQKYNVSDFLTKHVHMNWFEAQPYLMASYERQKNAVPMQTVAKSARRDLWAAFQAERRAEVLANPGQASQVQARQRASELARRSEINDWFTKAKATIAADPNLSVAQRKAERSIAQMNKVEEQRLLRLEIQRERAELKHKKSTAEQYRMWLQGKAQAGDSEALLELRGQSTGPVRDIRLMEQVISAVDERHDTGKLIEQAQRSTLQYTVERNGDVTYSRGGRELLLDTGRKIHMIDQSQSAIEQGLRLAEQKWGRKMALTGSDEFVWQTIQVAALKNMDIEFADPAHNDALQLERDTLRRGREAIDKYQKSVEAEQPSNHKVPEQAPHRPSPALKSQVEQLVATPVQDYDDGDLELDREIDAPRPF